MIAHQAQLPRLHLGHDATAQSGAGDGPWKRPPARKALDTGCCAANGIASNPPRGAVVARQGWLSTVAATAYHGLLGAGCLPSSR